MARYENLSLDKEMYSMSNKSFTQTLEELDPSDNYFGTPLEGLNAYQRQLKRFNIHTTGSNSDHIEKFFQTKDSSILFPEYIKNQVKVGMNEDNILNDIVATTTKIDSMDYRSIYYDESEKDVTRIKTKEELVHLTKHGRMLVASYEALRFQRIDLFSIILKQIGKCIVNVQIGDAINELLKNCQENKLMSFDEFYNSIVPYKMNTFLMSNTRNDLETPSFVHKFRNHNVPNGLVIGFDKTCALEMVKAGDLEVDYNKIIDRQLEQSAIYQVTGFSVIFRDAISTMK